MALPRVVKGKRFPPKDWPDQSRREEIRFLGVRRYRPALPNKNRAGGKDYGSAPPFLAGRNGPEVAASRAEGSASPAAGSGRFKAGVQNEALRWN